MQKSKPRPPIKQVIEDFLPPSNVVKIEGYAWMRLPDCEVKIFLEDMENKQWKTSNDKFEFHCRWEKIDHTNEKLIKLFADKAGVPSGKVQVFCVAENTYKYIAYKQLSQEEMAEALKAYEVKKALREKRLKEYEGKVKSYKRNLALWHLDNLKNQVQEN